MMRSIVCWCWCAVGDGKNFIECTELVSKLDRTQYAGYSDMHEWRRILGIAQFNLTLIMLIIGNLFDSAIKFQRKGICRTSSK